MSETRPVDVSEAEFEGAVVERSRTVPVVVDFWAAWCGPCHALAPALEEAVAEMAGAVELVKVNADENPGLAAHWNVRGLPTVQLFKDGRPVDRFVGAQPLGHIRQFLRSHCTTEADRRATEAARLLESGDLDGARRAYEEALTLDPAAPEPHIGLAHLALRSGDHEAVERHAAAVSPAADGYESLQSLVGASQLIRSAVAIGGREQCQSRLDADSADLEARYALAGHALATGDYRRALELYLEVATADRKWRDEAARKAMLVVFALLGTRHPMSDEFRDRLRSVYY